MKQTKLVLNILFIIISIVLYICGGLNLYATMRVSKMNFGFIVLATILFIYRKEFIYLLVERNAEK